MMPTEPKPVKPVEVPVPSRKPEIQEPAPDVLPTEDPPPLPNPFPDVPDVIIATDDSVSPGR